jgi:YegS/Rv2252/BmrU family lipid kinase
MVSNVRLKLLFVINPISGGKKKSDWEEEIQKRYQDSTYQVKKFILQGKNDEAGIQHMISSFHPDKVIAVGGDGTIKSVAELLLNTKIPLGIIPAGSANGMAKELNLPGSPTEVFEVINNGVAREIDVILINGKEISVHLSDLGLNALLIKYYLKNKKHGMWSYARAMFKVLREKKYLRLNLEVNGHEMIRTAYMVALANTRTYGTGAIINPQGSIYDGKFEVVVVRRLTLRELIRMIITHKPFDPKNIEVLEAERAKITSRHSSYFQVDGEYRGKTTHVTAEILPGALRVLLPG